MRQPRPIFVLYWLDPSKIPKLHEQCGSWPLLDCFALDVRITYETRWIFHQFSGASILVFRSSWVRYAYSVCNKFTSLTSVTYVIPSMTFLNVSATPGIVITRIGSQADVCAGCPCGWVDWTLGRWLGTEFCVPTGYHPSSSPIIQGKLFCAILTHSPRVFPHRIDNGNPITIFWVSSLHIIGVATEVKVLPSPISCATSAPGISESHTHLLRMNHMAQIWCARNFVSGRHGSEYLCPGTWLLVDWRIGMQFRRLTFPSRHSCSNFLLIVLRTVLNPELVLSGSRTCSPSSYSWMYLAHSSISCWSSIISFSISEGCWADELILRRSWNSSQC